MPDKIIMCRMTIGLFTILLEFDWLLHDVFAFEIIEIYWLDFFVLRIFIGESGVETGG